MPNFLLSAYSSA